MNGSGDGNVDLSTSNVFSQFLTLLLAEKSGLGISDGGKGVEELEKLASDLTKRFEQSFNEPASAEE